MEDPHLSNVKKITKQKHTGASTPLTSYYYITSVSSRLGRPARPHPDRSGWEKGVLGT
jgi:hypothetical protein